MPNALDPAEWILCDSYEIYGRRDDYDDNLALRLKHLNIPHELVNQNGKFMELYIKREDQKRVHEEGIFFRDAEERRICEELCSEDQALGMEYKAECGDDFDDSKNWFHHPVHGWLKSDDDAPAGI